MQTKLARLAGALAGTGSGVAAILGALGVATWLIYGAVSAHGYDDRWHMIIHSTGAGVALIMVFVIQFHAHRQARAVLLKLDELIRTDAEARDAVIGVEHAPVGKQERLERQMKAHSDGGRKK
ncbi:MAG TPA: low affinity iron permease family protein [Candidatus Limnocylindrales bacterium]